MDDRLNSASVLPLKFSAHPIPPNHSGTNGGLVKGTAQGGGGYYKLRNLQA